jgi:hypothetical protein
MWIYSLNNLVVRRLGASSSNASSVIICVSLILLSMTAALKNPFRNEGCDFRDTNQEEPDSQCQ